MYIHFSTDESGARAFFERFNVGATREFEPDWDHGYGFNTTEATIWREGVNLYTIRYGRYMSEVPSELIDTEITITAVELIRLNTRPTRATSGRYVENLIEATVDSIYPAKAKQDAALYAQNIKVQGPDLKSVLAWHSLLSQGLKVDACVEPWE